MPKVHHVLKARKAVPSAGINVGDSYYWWKFRYGGKRYSKTPPKQSQLTQSEFLAQVYDIEDEIAGLTADDSMQAAIEDIAQRLRDLAEECEQKRENMPEQLQESDTGTLLQERADACNETADSLDALDFEFEEDSAKEAAAKEYPDDPDEQETMVEEARQEFYDALLEEVQSMGINY